ncbi:MAG: MATE family efflux transporter [Verrucomicrobia bacterium]|nr:MATE family efflux transporter [Verrucomicrobiota bacterium]
MPATRLFRTELTKTLALACPIVAGQVGQMLMGLIDTIMVGQVGTSSLAAAAFANCIVSVAFVFGIGILTSVGVLVSRVHGAGMDQHKQVILCSAIWLAATIGVLLATVITLAQPWLSIFRQPQAVLTLAKPFIAILSWSLVPALVFISSKVFSEALSKPLAPALIMYLGVALNVFLNWVLIFGNLGAPALGLVGAGYATLIARIATMTATLAFCLYVTGSGLSILLPGLLSLPTIKSLLRIGLPAGFQLLSEVGAFAFAAVLMGWIGTAALAAHQIAITCAATTFMFPLGIAQAVGVRIGQTVGAGTHELVRVIGFGGLCLSGSMMLVFAVVYATLGHSIANGFDRDTAVVDLTSSLLLVAGLFQIADGVQVTAMGGLRGLADVRAPMILAFVFYWLCAIPIGYTAAFVFRAGAVGIWAGLAAGLFLAAITLTTRFWLLTRPGKRFEVILPAEGSKLL